MFTLLAVRRDLRLSGLQELREGGGAVSIRTLWERLFEPRVRQDISTPGIALYAAYRIWRAFWRR